MFSTQVPIDDILPYTQATAIANQTVFGTNWTANYFTDVIVFYTPANSTPDDATQQLMQSQYSVAFIGSQQDVQVTLVNPANAGDIITITRMTPANRENLYSNTNFVPTMLNQDFGILTLVDQQAQLVNQLIGPRYNYSSTPVQGIDNILPILQPNQIWQMNSTRTAILAVDNSGGGGGNVLALLASTAFGEGASLVALQNQSHVNNQTVQTLADAAFIVATNNGSMQNAIALGDLATGILKNTTITGVPTISAPLTSIDGLTTIANEMLYTTAPNTYATTPLSTDGRAILDTTYAALLVSIAALPLAGGTLTGALNMDGNQINDLGTPTLPTDAATKGYVDSGAFLPLAGGTMSGAINMSNFQINNLLNPTHPQDAVTQNYLVNQLTNYLSLAGGTMTGPISMGSHAITNLLNPVNPQDAATKSYADSIASGFTVILSTAAATTANLNATQAGAGIGATLTNAGAQSAFAVDGYSASVNDRILVKNQTATQHNGVYSVTTLGSGVSNWVLTRTTDYDTSAQIKPGTLIAVNNGTANANTSWLETATVTTVDTDPILFSQFTFSSTSFLMKSANLNDVANPATSFGNISPLTTKGDLIGFGSSNIRIPVGASDGMMLQVSSVATSGVAWSTATYPSTATANGILFGSATNVFGQIPTANSGFLLTNPSGVPSIGNELIFSTNPGLILNYTGAQGSTGGAYLQLQANSGAAMGSSKALGIVTFGGAFDASSDIGIGAYIAALTTQAWTSSHLGTSLLFYTVPNNSTTETLALTLNQDQSATFANTVNATTFVGALTGNASTATTLSSILPINLGGTNVATVTTAPTASAWAGWDANSNLSANNFIEGYLSTVTSGSLVTLTVASPYQQYFTGSTAQTVRMPVVSTLVLGQSWLLVNNSSATMTVQSSGANTITTLVAGAAITFTCIATSGTTAASWSFNEQTGQVASGVQNQLAWYANSGTTVSGLSTANNSFLATDGGGVPAWTTTFPSGIFGATGKIGSTLSSNIPVGSAGSITNSGTVNVTSISLTAGTWLITGNVAFSSATFSQCVCWCSTSSATIPNQSNYNQLATTGNDIGALGLSTPTLLVTVASTQTVYLSAFALYGSGSGKVSGTITGLRIY